MIFETANIPFPLDKYVESIFYFKGFVPDHSVERVVPTGNVFILFELDNFTRNTFDDDLKPNGNFSKAWVSGMHQRYINISAHDNSEMLGIQLKSMGAYPFFTCAISNLNNTVKPAKEYFGKTVLKVREEVIQEGEITQKFNVVEKWLSEILDESKSAPEELLAVLSRLADQPFSKHEEVLSDYPKTKKHLIDQFKKYGGLTPKVLHRIIRFSRLLQKINQQEEINWAEIAYETGYSDQSHFIKDFQYFSGFNPSRYIRNGYKGSEPNFFPLDKRG